VALVVPVVVVRHLGKGKPSLQRVDNVERAAHPRMLFEGFTDAKDSGKPEHVVVQGNQHLSKEMSHNGIAKIIKPMVLVSCP